MQYTDWFNALTDITHSSTRIRYAARYWPLVLTWRITRHWYNMLPHAIYYLMLCNMWYNILSNETHCLIQLNSQIWCDSLLKSDAIRCSPPLTLGTDVTYCSALIQYAPWCNLPSDAMYLTVWYDALSDAIWCHVLSDAINCLPDTIHCLMQRTI